MHGIQVAGLGNIVRKDVVFLQAAGLMNYGGEVRAMQAAGLANVASASLRGLQIAGLGNVVNADSGGAQVAGLVNYSRDGLAGLQAREHRQLCGYGGWRAVRPGQYRQGEF